MLRAGVLSMLVCVSGAFAQVDSAQPVEAASDEAATATEPMSGDATDALAGPARPIDAAEVDYIGRINAEIDGRAVAGDGEDGVFPIASGSGRDTSNLLQGLFALSFVLALIFLVYYGVRKWGKNVPILAGASLGTVLGRIHLERGNTLHFVRTGGRVLIVGVNGSAVSLVADLDAAAFESAGADAPLEDSNSVVPFNPDSFLAQLQASSRTLESPSARADDASVEDDEIAALRGDIQRLQDYLREESRESQD